MPGDVAIKFCGLTRRRDMDAALRAGVRYVGLNFVAASPRHVTPAAAAVLAADLPPGICKVALTVNADDALFDEIVEAVPVDMLQLHGVETPNRVAAIQGRYGLPVMKAVGVATAEDLPTLAEHGRVADQLLVDAKPMPGAALPGGNGLAFDWRLIAGRRWPVPWMLAGGLTAENVRRAVALTGARQVDVASGIEAEPGLKDPARMATFAAALRH